jgi:hypothetical protein
MLEDGCAVEDFVLGTGIGLGVLGWAASGRLRMSFSTDIGVCIASLVC